VEVKTCSSTDFGLPQDFVKPKKNSVVSQSNWRFFVNQQDLDVRFDIIRNNCLYQCPHKTYRSTVDVFYHFKAKIVVVIFCK
jgi:putative endonuclease